LVHPRTFFNELNVLQEQFNKCDDLKHISVASLVRIDKNTFVITDEHIEEDSKDEVIGSTKKGVGPASRDKYARVSKQVQDIPELQRFVIDFPDVIHQKDTRILGEGAQGFYLDVNFGDYPYVTSTHCSMAAVPLNGIPMKSLNKVYGAIKIYSTYVGKNKFQGEDPRFDLIAEAGQEFGSTTGRKRQVNWLDMDKLIYALKINEVTDLVISKMDVFRNLGIFALVKDNKVIEFEDEWSMKSFILNLLHDKPTNFIQNIIFSESPNDI
jgi:adenylosuccinate synthase